MAEYEVKVREKLREYKCSFKRHGKGDHDIWYSPITNRVFPVDGVIKSRHLANVIMRQAGIKHHF
ncbi:MAG: type II toxin-antitoxin system HicA family toxin [Treponema sp.]|nr:type II toxin-antitoxin system HicA family toxin [Treponema sp.]